MTTSTPLNQKTNAIAFVNTATTPGVLNGPLNIHHDRSRRDLRIVELHWGRSEKNKLAVNSKIVAYGSLNTGSETQPHYVYQQPLLHIFTNTPIPSGASHLLVWVTDAKETQHLYASRPLKSNEHLLPPSASALE
ncbi:hypothetical protein AB835_03890 [Candidatus Endobugula sertula]|uniref:Uncharacterized protein n=1 Tax=Candidatus Endobugula sertula TaxID=62101 RepID=A0A1D2QSF7_9GAMM|nr:hypothetical protein AB835_03890 [Candidatus Endobugula sertula]